jgi:pyruvate formate lyase activating enzyme
MLDRRILPLVRDASVAPTAREPLADELAARARPGVLFEPGPAAGSLRCTACAHRCVVADGRRGACGVRYEKDGVLHVPSGYVARAYVRAVETNTIYHVLPGARSLTFGMYGCDLRCPYCHNWQVSQALREATTKEAPSEITARALVDHAIAEDCRVVCAAYNEPAIAAEWVHEIFADARARGLVTALITDGNATPELLAFLRPVTDVYRVDLKGFTEAQYRTLGGRLAPVLEAIRSARALGYWVEVVTLVVPSFNDDLAGLRSLALAIAAIDPAIPWHLNAFQPRYRMRDRPTMSAGLLVSAAGVAYANGLRFVYAGNVDHQIDELSHTRCPGCHEVVVERRSYETIAGPHLDDAARCCARCATEIPGVWSGRQRTTTSSTPVRPRSTS